MRLTIDFSELPIVKDDRRLATNKAKNRTAMLLYGLAIPENKHEAQVFVERQIVIKRLTYLDSCVVNKIMRQQNYRAKFGVLDDRYCILINPVAFHDSLIKKYGLKFKTERRMACEKIDLLHSLCIPIEEN